MRLAAKSNGLTGDGVQPWHVKATYQLLDDQGNVKDQGTYEEFWAGPAKYKRTFTGKAFSRTDYVTKNGVLVSGDQDSQYTQAYEIRSGFFSPMPSPESIEKNSYVLQQRESGGVKLDCLNFKDALGNPFGPTWCLSAGKPILRFSAPFQGRQILYNRILRFEGRFIAGDLEFIQQGKTTLTAHIDTIETLDPIDEAIFLPPADAAPQKPRKITISGGVAAGNTHQEGELPNIHPSHRPLTSREPLLCRPGISKEGRIVDLHVVGGPAMLAASRLGRGQAMDLQALSAGWRTSRSEHHYQRSLHALESMGQALLIEGVKPGWQPSITHCGSILCCEFGFVVSHLFAKDVKKDRAPGIALPQRIRIPVRRGHMPLVSILLKALMELDPVRKQQVACGNGAQGRRTIRARSDHSQRFESREGPNETRAFQSAVLLLVLVPILLPVQPRYSTSLQCLWRPNDPRESKGSASRKHRRADRDNIASVQPQPASVCQVTPRPDHPPKRNSLSQSPSACVSPDQSLFSPWKHSFNMASCPSLLFSRASNSL